MNRSALVLTMFLGAALTGKAMALGPTRADGSDDAHTNKGQTRAGFTYQIVKKWAPHVQEAYSVSPQRWTQDMLPLFKLSSIDAMRRAASAKTFDAMNTALLDRDFAGAPAKSTKLLGETTNDLVFVPITPCRIFDTRLAGGQIPTNTVRAFDVTAVSSYSFQGGDATNCGGAGAAGSFAAAAINFTVVGPVVPPAGGGGPGSGFLTAYPFLATQPATATMVFRDGQVLSNYAVVKLDQGASANELNIYSSHLSHVVADLVGYYINPVLGELDCQETFSNNLIVNAGSTGTTSSPACAAGYTIVSGGCTMSTFDGRVVSSRQFPGSNTHFCAFRNESGSNSNIGVAYGRCCRLPSGRTP